MSESDPPSGGRSEPRPACGRAVGASSASKSRVSLQRRASLGANVQTPGEWPGGPAKPPPHTGPGTCRVSDPETPRSGVHVHTVKNAEAGRP